MEIIFSKKFIDILAVKCTEVYGNTELINPETCGLILDNPPDDLAEIVGKLFSKSDGLPYSDVSAIVATILVLKKAAGNLVENLDQSAGKE